MALPNVFVLGSDEFARKVCAAINKWKIGDCAIIDKPTVLAENPEGAFEDETVCVTHFRKVEKIDFVVLVAYEATAENDTLIYQRLSRWQAEVIVISDTQLKFARAGILIPGHGNVTDEVLWFLHRTIAEPSEVVPKKPPPQHTTRIVVLSTLGVAILLYLFYPQAARSSKLFEFKKGEIYIEYPGSVVSEERKGDVEVCAEPKLPKPLVAKVEVVLDFRDIECKGQEKGRISVVFDKLRDKDSPEDPEQQCKVFTCTMDPSLGDDVDVAVYFDGKKEQSRNFEMRTTSLPEEKFSKYRKSLTEVVLFVAFLLGVISETRKLWLKSP